MRMRAILVLALALGGCDVKSAGEDEGPGLSLGEGAPGSGQEQGAATEETPSDEAPAETPAETPTGSAEETPTDEAPAEAGGDGTCAGYFECAGECAWADVECYDACAAATSGEGLGQALDLTRCIDEAGCFEATSWGAYYACLEGSCGAETTACYPNAVPTGDAGCEGYSNCLAACPPYDEACYTECWTGASLTGSGQYYDLTMCLAEAGCDQETTSSGWLACAEAACAEVSAVCFESWWPAGEGACTDLMACFGGCGEDEACWSDCGTATSPEGLSDYWDYAECVVDAGCDTETTVEGWYTCADAACHDASAACYGPSWPSGDGSCADLVACLGTCGPTDEACWADCGGAASPQGAGQYSDLWICLDESGCYDDPVEPAFSACAAESCGELWGICFE